MILSAFEKRSRLRIGFLGATSAGGVAAIRRWFLKVLRCGGREVLDRLNGMFGLALYDREAKRLYLARDRMGIKPLYVWREGSRLAFASEAKFFFTLPDFIARVNPGGLASFFLYGHGYDSARVLEGIRQLQPAELLTIESETGRCSSSSIVPTAARVANRLGAAKEMPVKSAIRAVRETLSRAVERQVVADVPVGVFLSGGVDSSILTALCAQLLGPAATKSFTLGYTGFNMDFNEVEEARAIAKHLGVKHYVYEASSRDLIDGLEQMVWHYDEPFGDAAALNMMVLSRLVRTEVTVALAGEGSDELFGGYRRYQVERLIRKLGPLSLLAQDLVRTTAAFQLKKMPRRLAILLRSLSYKTAGRRYSAYFESGIDLDALIRPEWRSDFDPRRRLEELYPDELNGIEPVSALCWADQRFWLVDTYMEKSDKGSMANSLEVRVPFLDNEVVDLANTLPDRFRLRGRQGKWLLKRAFSDLLPEQVFVRRKRGFGVPVSGWLRHELRDFFADTVISPTSRCARVLRPADDSASAPRTRVRQL